jgi:hypothetical protein
MTTSQPTDFLLCQLHKCALVATVWRGYQELRAFLATLDSTFSPGHLAEGIVFHHPNGRRAKIKRKDFAHG